MLLIKSWIEESRSIVILSGAGVSTDPTWTRTDDETIEWAHWKKQKVLDMDCNEFSRNLMNPSES